MNASQPMVESLAPSIQTDSQNTGKTSKLTPAAALEILQQAILNCQHSGIDARVAPLYQAATPSVVIVLANVNIDAGNLVMTHD